MNKKILNNLLSSTRSQEFQEYLNFALAGKHLLYFDIYGQDAILQCLAWVVDVLAKCPSADCYLELKTPDGMLPSSAVVNTLRTHQRRALSALPISHKARLSGVIGLGAYQEDLYFLLKHRPDDVCLDEGKVSLVCNATRPMPRIACDNPIAKGSLGYSHVLCDSGVLTVGPALGDTWNLGRGDNYLHIDQQVVLREPLGKYSSMSNLPKYRRGLATLRKMSGPSFAGVLIYLFGADGWELLLNGKREALSTVYARLVAYEETNGNV